MPKNNQLVLLTPAFPGFFGTQLFCLTVSFFFLFPSFFIFNLLIYWGSSMKHWKFVTEDLSRILKGAGPAMFDSAVSLPSVRSQCQLLTLSSHPSSQGCAHRAWLQGLFPFPHTETGTVLNLWWYVPPACMRRFRENIITHFIKSLFMFCSVSIFHSHICLLSDRADNIK